MKLIGKKRLLSNDYKEITIRQKGKTDVIECRISGDPRVGDGNVLGDFESILSATQTDNLKISEILKYFTRYSKVCSIKEENFHGRNIIELKGNERRLTLSMRKDNVVEQTLKDIIKVYYDNLYNECFKFIDDYQDCIILIYDTKKSNHYKCINSEDIDEVIIANSRVYNQYIVNFIKLLIDNYNDIISVSALSDNLVLIIGRHKINMPYNEEIKYYCFDHNITISCQKSLQLKVKGI